MLFMSKLNEKRALMRYGHKKAGPDNRCLPALSVLTRF